MAFNITIPRPNESELKLGIDPGEVFFILGANGTGKSSLINKIYQQNINKVRHISAHRQNWFNSGAVDMSPQHKKNHQQNILSADANHRARWRDDYSMFRAGIAIFDLLDSENIRARRITAAVDGNQITEAQELAKSDAPIKVINELLRLSNIPIIISIKENDEIIAKRDDGLPYSIAELSDGERNALLLAANILTTRPNTLILIDEPERHLHRSIISPLLSMLFKRRVDCAFIISTHDVLLPVDHRESSSLLLRKCVYENSQAQSWEANLISNTDAIDENLKMDILGARQQILFIEGSEQSMDKPLYSLIFPNLSIIPKSSCHEVAYY